MSSIDIKRCNNKFFKVTTFFYLTIYALSHAYMSRHLYRHTHVDIYIRIHSPVANSQPYTCRHPHVDAYTHICTHIELSPYNSVTLVCSALISEFVLYLVWHKSSFVSKLDYSVYKGIFLFYWIDKLEYSSQTLRLFNVMITKVKRYVINSLRQETLGSIICQIFRNEELL